MKVGSRDTETIFNRVNACVIDFIDRDLLTPYYALNSVCNGFYFQQPGEILMVTTAAQVHGGDNISIITETTSMESKGESLNHSVFSLKGQ